MGAFLGVAAGSAEPPKFIHLTYASPGRRTKRVALIGKGITFDSGGLDLKTSEGMLRMKNDMAGAAAVLGIMGALGRLRPPVERSEEHTSELQSRELISYAVFCL